MTEHKELNYDRILVVMLGKMMLHHQVRYPIIWHINHLCQYGRVKTIWKCCFAWPHLMRKHTNKYKKKEVRNYKNKHDLDWCYSQSWDLYLHVWSVSSTLIIAEIWDNDQQLNTDCWDSNPWSASQHKQPWSLLRFVPMISIINPDHYLDW